MKLKCLGRLQILIYNRSLLVIFFWTENTTCQITSLGKDTVPEELSYLLLRFHCQISRHCPYSPELSTSVQPSTSTEKGGASQGTLRKQQPGWGDAKVSQQEP